jgi:hypothetical protein
MDPTDLLYGQLAQNNNNICFLFILFGIVSGK